MAMDTRAVFLSLDQLTWAEAASVGGGGGPPEPTAAPFLWTIFWTLDATLQPVFTVTTGNHRDLGVKDVKPGVVINIPESLGYLSTQITPFEFQNMEIGWVGVVVVLMNDGGHITPHGIAAGHDALNTGVQNVINGLIATAITLGSPPTQAQIDAAVKKADLADQVSNAIENAQSVCENLWSLSGEDSEIGDVNMSWSIADFLSPPELQDFELDIGTPVVNLWKLTGTISFAEQCPAVTSAALLAPIFHGSAPTTKPTWHQNSERFDLSNVLQLMRDFRDRKALLSGTTLRSWWNLLKKHSPELACRIAVSREVQEKLYYFFQHVVVLIMDDEHRISHECIEDCETWMDLVASRSSSRLRNDFRIAFGLIDRLEGKTLTEALRIAATRKAE